MPLLLRIQLPAGGACHASRCHALVSQSICILPRRLLRPVNGAKRGDNRFSTAHRYRPSAHSCARHILTCPDTLCAAHQIPISPTPAFSRAVIRRAAAGRARRRFHTFVARRTSVAQELPVHSTLSDVSRAPENEAPLRGKEEAVLDPESDEDVAAGLEEVKAALSRPAPVNSDYLPLPWKGRLGYACVCTYLRYATPPVYISRTCRISSILAHRHPLKHPSRPPHPIKNRPDRDQPADVARGLAYVESLGLANARDLVKMLRWNERYGIKFMRLSSEMFPFASHEKYGYKLAPFASKVLAEAGRVAAQLGHRLTMHPGQFTQLGSPRKEVIDRSIRDLEYHSELLQLLKLPPQQDRDAVMVLHMGGVFGDKAATLDRFRENYKRLSQDIKNRLVLENDDVSWSVHDLLPICEELNIPLVLDFHHHNIVFDADKLREGTLDIMQLFDRIKATWTRKGITQKMHYSEPTPSAVTPRQRRKHSPRVSSLPPCDPTMDLMIEAKDKEQAVFELMRKFKLPGHHLFNDMIPHVREDENKPWKPQKKDPKRYGGFIDLQKLAPLLSIPEEEVGMGGPQRRVYWPPGKKDWLWPAKRAVSRRTAEMASIETISRSGDSPEVDNKATSENPVVSDTPGRRAKRTATARVAIGERKSSRESSLVSTSGNDEPVPSKLSEPLMPSPTATTMTPHHHHAFDCCSIGIFDNSAYDRQTSSLASLSPDIETKDEAVAPKSPFFSRWRKPLALLRPQRSIAPSLRAWRNIKKPGRGTFSDFFFRALFAPQAPSRARDRVRARLWTFRYETLPSFRHRAQARLYRAILRRQESLRKIRRGAVLSLLLGRRRLRGQSAGNIASGRRLPSRATSQTLEDADSGTMANSGSTESGMRWGDSDEPGREWGARRRKVYGYLKAANELRQIYASQLSQRNRQDSYDGESLDVPGAFPDVDIARSGDEEMVLFPSYTRRRVRKKRPEASGQSQRKPGTDENIERPRSPGDLEFWKQEWEKYEEDNASVDVDVRGWIYTPQHGSMSRKHRLLIALARKLSGIPAPSTSSNGSPLSGQLGLQQAVKEDEEVAREAQSIINRAEREADPAWKGGHFRGPDGRQGADGVSRVASQVSTSSLGKDELSVANARLMERLRPFMANPLVGTPVTMFFFNDKESQARTTATDGAGHFSFRAALGFVPTHVRVIASESLSATEEVQIIEPKGVSLISDIDDTIKHTAITSGAKEMFRNTFVRELEDLAIPGIKEWYTKMANMGVRMHYVSNSPWQLYPLLKRYFTLVGLPPGSFHLKQYSGMLQGIFEPTAERKRGALEKIMADFPERKFILVGDSGEADLEVYTDLVLANPGRVLAVFIRDITTLEKRGFFDQSFDHNGVSRPNPRTVPMKHDSDAVDNRPPLPPRRPVEQRSNSASANARTLDNADLISLGESGNETDQNPDSANRKPPVKPTKPSALRTTSADSATQSKNDDEETSSTVQQKEVIRRKPAPPLPSKPRSLSIPRPGPSAERPPPLPARPKPNPATDSPASSALPSAKSEPYQPAESYMGAVKNMVSTAYSSLPSMTREHLNSRSNTPNDSGTESQPGEERRTRSQRPPPPVPPPRRSNTAASTASSASAGPETLRGPTSNANAASYDRVLKLSSSSSSLSARASSASSRPVPSRTNTNISTTSTTTTTNSNNDYDSGLTYHDPSDGLPQPPAPLPNKREELWRRRWERAQAVLDEHGVILASWRVGSDVEDIAVWLVEAAQKSK